MKKEFKVKVNDENNFNLTSEDVRNLDIIPAGNNSYHLIHQHQSLEVRVTHQDFNQRQVDVEISGNKFRVEIGTSLDQLIEEMGFSAGAATSVNQVKAPMPGLILDVMIKEGQQVKKGDSLLVLEAMKMENTIVAPGDGLVKNLGVEAGLTVEKNQLLLELG